MPVRGFYLLEGDGALDWGVYYTGGVKNDFSRTNGIPGASDDTTQGYESGSIRITSADAVYICLTADAGTATWEPLAGGSVPTSRTITATAPLTIGGGASADLSSDRTIAIVASSALVPGSMSAADFKKLATIGTVVSHATTPQTIDGAYQLYRVTYAAGTFVANLPTATTNWPVGESRAIMKDHAGAFGIDLTPDATHSIHGGAGGAAVTLFGSAVVPATADPRPIWLVTRLSTTEWAYS
jgi:hypothetical protein